MRTLTKLAAAFQLNKDRKHTLIKYFDKFTDVVGFLRRTSSPP